MNFKTTLFALGALIILAAVFVYVRMHKVQPAAKPARQIFAQRLGKLKTLTITRRKRHTVAFVRHKDVWWMTKPLHTTARAYRLTALASALRRVKYIKKFKLHAKGAHSLAATGLVHPRAAVQFVDGSGHTHELFLGARRASGGLFARLVPHGHTLYVLHSQWRQRLTRPLAGYRSRQLATASASRVVGVAIAHRKQTVTIHKVGSKWMIEQPITTRANAKVINHLISNLTYLQANAFAHVIPQEAGLVPPLVRVTLLEKPRTTPPLTENPQAVKPQPKAAPAKTPPLKRIVVNFGHYTDLTKKFVYASRPGDPSVFTVGADIFASVNKHLNALRDSAVMPMALTGATAIRLHTAAASPLAPAGISLTKIKGRWSMRARLGKALLTLPASGGAVKRLLHALHMLHANKFVDGAGNLPKIGLKPPVRSISLTLPGRSRVQTLLIGRPQKAQPVTPVMRDGQATVMLVQNGDLKGTRPNILALRSRRIASWRAQSVERIAVQRPGKPMLTLMRQKKHWLAQSGKASAARADASNVTMLLGSIDPLMAKKWISTGTNPPAGTPVATVSIRSSAPPTVAGAAAIQKNVQGPRMPTVQTQTLKIFALRTRAAVKSKAKTTKTPKQSYIAELAGPPLPGLPPSASRWTFRPQNSLVSELLHTRYAKATPKKPSNTPAKPVQAPAGK